MSKCLLNPSTQSFDTSGLQILTLIDNAASMIAAYFWEHIDLSLACFLFGTPTTNHIVFSEAVGSQQLHTANYSSEMANSKC